MRRMRKRIIAFLLAVIMVFTTGCSSGFYADELPVTDKSVSDNNTVVLSDSERSIDAEDNGISGNNPQKASEDELLNEEGNSIDGVSIVDEVSRYNLGDFDENGQYHFDPNSEESVNKWMNLYMPSGDGMELLNQTEEWWSNLTWDESEFAKCATYKVDLPFIYSDQDITEVISIALDGIDLNYFFKGSIYEGLTLNDLLVLKENGYTLKDLEDATLNCAYNKYGILIEDPSLFKEIEDPILSSIISHIISTGNTTKVRNRVQSRAAVKMITAKPYIRKTGYKGTYHGDIWWIDIGTKPALCMDYGNTCRNSYTYKTNANYEVSNIWGYFVYRANSTNKRVRVAAQIAFWLYRGAWGSGGLNYGQAAAKGMVKVMLRDADGNYPSDWESIANLCWSIYHGAQRAWADGSYLNYKAYTWNTSVPGAQRLVTYEIPPDIDEDEDGDDKPPVPPEEPEPPTAPDVPETPLGDIFGDYNCGTSLLTTVKTNKRDIETQKPLEGVGFKYDGDFGSYLITDSEGNCSYTNEDHFSETEIWSVTSGSHEVKVGEDSHGNDIKETKYYYTCQSCGQSGDYDSESSMKEAGEQHCVNHAKEIAEGRLNATVSAYKFKWVVTETTPRTSNHSDSLITGGTASCTTGYHNNPVITQSNTESGYHRDEHRVINVNLTNERVRGTITINKSDMDYLNCRTEGDNNQDFIPQGDASLAGAVYGLYANADIIRPDGKSGDRTGLPTNIRMDYCTALPFRLFTLFTHGEHPKPTYLCAFPACSRFGGNTTVRHTTAGRSAFRQAALIPP